MRCSVKSVNERNPHFVLYFSQRTALVNREEGGDDVKSAWPSDALGYTRATMASNNEFCERVTL